MTALPGAVGTGVLLAEVAAEVEGFALPLGLPSPVPVGLASAR